MASTTASAGKTREDAELARLALAGDGDAFAELYDRHERRVFGFCLRMLGSEDEAAEATQETFMRLLRRLPALEGRELNFVAYALTAARHACYDAIHARRRVEPVGEPLEPTGPEPGDIELDPERAALLAATREAVRAANARLPERQREVLALRECEQLSYDQIGEVLGMNANAVAQLISRARIRLRDLVSGSALESVAASSPECERALPLLARVQDEQPEAAAELDWVRAHLSACETCRVSRAAMQEAGVSYRALGPIVVVAWLRHATIARAARMIGVDWSHVAGPRDGGAHGAGSAHGGPAQGGGPALTGGDGEGGTGLAPAMDASAGPRPASHRLRRRLVAVALVCVVIGLVVGASVTRDASVRNATSLSISPSVVHPSSPAHADALVPHRHEQTSRRARRELRQPAPPVVTTPDGAQASQAVPPSAPAARRPASRHAATHHAGHPKPPSPPPAVTPPPATTPTAPASTPPTSEGAPPATTTSGETTSTTTSPGTPGGSPEGGEHGCALAALAC
jgi:RNA polymerase sigma-70 factor (ECF subfamily)